jgi:hypothetical protein
LRLSSLDLAAADHLSVVLATADAEGWSTTQAPEHLLAREVEAPKLAWCRSSWKASALSA